MGNRLSITNHLGLTINSGHYTALVNAGNETEGDNWILYDDDKVCATTKNKIATQNGYILFYTAQN